MTSCPLTSILTATCSWVGPNHRKALALIGKGRWDRQVSGATDSVQWDLRPNMCISIS